MMNAMMLKLYLRTLLMLLPGTLAGTSCPDIVSRREWGSMTSSVASTEALRPATYVIVHHTGTPKCATRRDCEKMVRSLQRTHVKHYDRKDVGYNFLIGTDGNIYEGIGWDRSANNTPQYDRHGIHIAIIGDYTSSLPDDRILDITKRLIECGVNKNVIDQYYWLYGHKQVEHKDCPGNRLYKELKNWTHWTSF